MFNANKEDTKKISKYFSELMIRTSFTRPKTTFLAPLEQINLSWKYSSSAVMKLFSNSFENFQDCWLRTSSNFSIFPLFILINVLSLIVSNIINSYFFSEIFVIIEVKQRFLFGIFKSVKVRKTPFTVLDFLLEINSTWWNFYTWDLVLEKPLSQNDCGCISYTHCFLRTHGNQVF